MPKVTMVEFDREMIDGLMLTLGKRDEVAQALGVATSAVNRWVSDGRIPERQLERLKALVSAKFRESPSLTAALSGIPSSQTEERIEEALRAARTEDLIKELSERGLDVIVKKPARTAKPK
jgi:hypothetical protein